MGNLHYFSSLFLSIRTQLERRNGMPNRNRNRVSGCEVLPTSQSLRSEDCQEVVQPLTIDIINVICLPSQGREQLGLVVRYLHDGAPVERLVEYIECETCTGVAICNQIVQAVANLGLDPEMCRAQTYDGAGNIAGSQNGCAKHFQEVCHEQCIFIVPAMN